MKKIFSSLLTLGLVASQAGGRSPLLNEFLEKDDYLMLEQLLETNKYRLDPVEYDYYLSLVESAFDRTGSSNRRITHLLEAGSHHLTDREKARILATMAVNHLREGHYDKAYEAYRTIYESDRLKEALEEKESYVLENAGEFLGTIAAFPYPACELADTTVIPFFRNRFSHIMVPVARQGIVRNFFFDTGANLSVIPEKTARKWDLEILESELEVYTATDRKMLSRVALADRIELGGMILRNVVFLVVPDEDLTFPQMGFGIEGIIGFPIIRQMGAFTIDNEQMTLTVHKDSPTATGPKNLFLDGLLILLTGEKDDERLVFNLDTGANQSELSFRYLNGCGYAPADTVAVQRASGGGVTRSDLALFEDFSFVAGGRNIHFPKITAHTEDYRFLEDKDGNLGQDFIMQFEQVTVDLRAMRIQLK